MKRKDNKAGQESGNDDNYGDDDDECHTKIIEVV